MFNAFIFAVLHGFLEHWLGTSPKTKVRYYSDASYWFLLSSLGLQRPTTHLPVELPLSGA